MGMLEMLDDLPAGWEVTSCDACGGRARYASPEGSVDLSYHEVLPGIVLSDIDLACSSLPVYHSAGTTLVTVNWCASGRCEVDFGQRGSLVVGAQTLCLSSSLAETFSYPTARYRGFEYFIDLDRIDAVAGATLDAFGLTRDALCEALVPHELGVTLAPDENLADAIRSVEAELAREHPRRPWLLLATCRLFMLLAEPGRVGSSSGEGYLQRSQRDMAQAIYQQIVEQATPSVDLGALAKRFGVSEASLRSYFTRVYGQSPVAFARSHALSQAARMLADTDSSIADIGQASGYANPSKFSAAFRRAYGVNPLEYRRRSRLS